MRTILDLGLILTEEELEQLAAEGNRLMLGDDLRDEHFFESSDTAETEAAEYEGEEYSIPYEPDPLIEDLRALLIKRGREHQANANAVWGEAPVRAADEPRAAVCECGGESHGWTHSTWCPKFVKEST